MYRTSGSLAARGSAEGETPDLKKIERLQAQARDAKHLFEQRELRVRELRAEITTWKTSGNYISPLKKATVVAKAEAELGRVREMHVREAIQDGRLTGWRILAVGTGTLILLDAAGHGLQWRAADTEPSFSPLVEYMWKNAKSLADASGFGQSPTVEGKSTEDTIRDFEKLIK